MIFLRLPELARSPYSIPFSRMHIWRLVRDGKFPAPVRLGENTIAWDEAEILAWLAARMDARKAGPGGMVGPPARKKTKPLERGRR
jgi:prophage regulatory protein